MKKVFLTAVAVFGFAFANAQEVKFGAKVGLGLSSISELDGAKSKFGFQVGGFAEIKVSDKFSVQPELLYSSVGVKQELVETYFGVTVSAEGDSKLSYVVVPVMAKFYVAEKISLEAGPQIGFLASAKADYTASGGGTSQSESLDIKDDLNSTDFSINLGGGYDVTENISLGLRYTLGLSQLQKELATGESASKNSLFQLSFAYKF